MKTKIYMMLAVATFSLGMASCSDFLDEDNKTGYTEDILYSTKSGIDGLMASCYAYARGWYGKEAAYGLSEGGSDIFLTGNDNRQKILIDYNGITPDVSTQLEKMNCNLDEYWELFYTAVNACNTAIVQVQKNKLLSEQEKQHYLGEAQFLRAFYYWHLVETWGAVQINKEPVADASTKATRNSVEEVYAFMLQDLTDAITNLQTQTAKTGHVNLWAAKAFKARVLLYKGSKFNDMDAYRQAATLSGEVISNSGAELYSDYADCWKMANESGIVNKEALWFVTYSDELAENKLPLRLKLDGDGKQIEWTQMMTRKKDNTGGNVAHMMFVGTWNAAPDVKNIFVRTTDDKTNMLNGVDLEYYYSQYGRGFTRYVPSLYLLDLYNDDTDQRYQASFRDVYELAPKLRLTDQAYRTKNKWVYKNAQDTVIYLSKKSVTQAMLAQAKGKYRLMSRTAVAGLDVPALYDEMGRPTTGQTSATWNNKEYQGDRMFISLKKFEDDDANRTANDKYTPEVTGRDFLVMRLSEMYLIKAEAELATGGDALATLNLLRKERAVKGKDNSLKGAVTLDVILDERARELCGEQQRWFDLERTGKLVERVKKYNPSAAANIQEFHKLRPIPTPQMDAVTNKGNIGEVGVFYQNPGY